jgi:hypothetical protein
MTGPRHIHRSMAIAALCTAARRTGVEPAALSPAQYRAFRAGHDDSHELPAEVTIGLLFGGWHRACEQAGALTRRPEDVEQHVRDALYGQLPGRVEQVRARG